MKNTVKHKYESKFQPLFWSVVNHVPDQNLKSEFFTPFR